VTAAQLGVGGDGQVPGTLGEARPFLAVFHQSGVSLIALPVELLSRAGGPGKQKIELAQDVARFANGSADAVLVVGFEEIKGS
jgi:hypothetical protein